MNAKERSYSNGIKKRKIEWPEYLEMVGKLCRKLKASKIKFKYVHGVPRGGLIPAVIISNALNIQMVDEWFLTTLDSIEGTKLIVDDIVDTSQTMVHTLSGFREDEKVFTATLFKHKKCKFVPDFYIETNDKWIIFPYERD
jgi:hypoxanthine phosphoribosyltransferase